MVFHIKHTQIGGENITLKEFVAHEIATLEESELRAVAEYILFLKFRARTSMRPHVLKPDLEAAYRDMAADEAREAEALEWAEATIGDVKDETR